MLVTVSKGYILLLLLLLFLFGCKKDTSYEFYVVARPDVNEMAIVKFGNNTKIITRDSCVYSSGDRELIFQELFEINNKDSVTEFSIVLIQKCEKIIDTTISTNDKLRLIGIMPGSYDRNERVYYYTEKNYITY